MTSYLQYKVEWEKRNENRKDRKDVCSKWFFYQKLWNVSLISNNSDKYLLYFMCFFLRKAGPFLELKISFWDEIVFSGNFTTSSFLFISSINFPHTF